MERAGEILILTLFNNLYLVMEVFITSFLKAVLTVDDWRQQEAVEVTSNEKVTQRVEETPSAGRRKL